MDKFVIQIYNKDSVIEMSVTDPEGKTLCANIKVTADDMEMLRQLEEIGKS